MSCKVAVIGGGVAGICSARACLSQGLRVTAFESRSDFGGIWDRSGPNPVFDSLTTNTSCFETAFSDVAPLRVSPLSTLTDNDNLCLTNGELHEYLLDTVSRTPGLREAFIFNSHVISVEDCDEGYEVRYRSTNESEETLEKEPSMEKFEFVIVATGMHHNPFLPKSNHIPGLDEFKGDVLHSSQYKNPAQVAGKRILVVGGSISGCEIVGDIKAACAGDTHVTLSTRSKRYLMVKQKEDQVALSIMNTRFHELQRLAGNIWDEEFSADMQKLITSLTTNESVGAPPADGLVHNPHLANWVPVNQKFLDASKKELMTWNIGGIKRINADGIVEFNDGAADTFDVVILATGYRVNLPFLDDATQQLVQADDAPDHYLDLFEYSMHPDRKHLAFVGMFMPGTASLPMFESQARWVAKVIANPEMRPSDEEMRIGISKYREERQSERAHIVVFGFEVLDRFSRLGGFDVDLSVFKEWTKALIFGPLVPAQFRLFGEGRKEDALAEFERQMKAAGFEKGDNKVEQGTLMRLMSLSAKLTKNGKSLRGLAEAVEYLQSVNGVNDEGTL